MGGNFSEFVAVCFGLFPLIFGVVLDVKAGPYEQRPGVGFAAKAQRPELAIEFFGVGSGRFHLENGLFWRVCGWWR